MKKDMKVIMSTLEAKPKDLMIATTKGWEVATGYLFNVEGFDFAALPLSETRKLVVVAFESGTHLFTVDIPKETVSNEDLLDVIQEKAITMCGLVINQDGKEKVSSEFDEMLRFAIEKCGEKPVVNETVVYPDLDTPLQ